MTKSSLLKLFVVAQARVMPNVLDVQEGLYTPSKWKNLQEGIGGSKIESVRDSENHKDLTWFIGFDFECSLGYEKVILRLGAAFAHNCYQLNYVATSKVC